MPDFISKLNSTLSSLYTSIENDGCNLLNELCDIDTNIFSKRPLKIFYNSQNFKSISLIINTIVIGIVFYYFFKLVLSLYKSSYIKNIHLFIIHTLVITILSLNSLYICKEFVSLNSQLTDVIESVLEDISGEKIDYSFLTQKEDTIEGFLKLQKKLSLKGMSESIICTLIISLIIIYSIRYIAVVLCIILSPFGILAFITPETTRVGKMWIRILSTCLIIQIINKFIIYILVSFNGTDNFSGAIVIGGLILMYKLNKNIVERGYIWKE